jgi:hypothetical protein
MADPKISALEAELHCVREKLAALNAAFAAQSEELRELRAELLPIRAAEALRHNFISCLILTAQNGFGRDVEPFLALSRETWGEEILFDAVKDLPHGALQKMDGGGELVFEMDALGARVLDAGGKPIPVMDPFGKQRTRLMYAAQAGDVARVKWLLARGARVELKDSLGRTALYVLGRAGGARGDGAGVACAGRCGGRCED